MQGTLFRRGKYIWAGFQINGKQKRISLAPLLAGKYTTHRQSRGKDDWELAEERLKHIIRNTKLENDYPYTYAAGLKLSDAAALFLKEKQNKKQSTYNGYKYALDQFLDFIDNKYIAHINEKDIKDFSLHLKKRLSHNTVENIIRHIRIFFNFCKEEKIAGQPIIEFNPVPSNKKLDTAPKTKTIIEIPSSEFDKIENYLKEHDIWQYRLIRFMRLTAMRISDAVNMQWETVYWQQGYINYVIQKTGKEHQLILYKQLIDFLKTFKKSSGKMFPYKGVNSVKFWKRTLKRLALPTYNLHQIRKTTITELINAGFDFETIHIFTGHSDPKTTWAHYRAIRNKKVAKDLANKIKF